MASSTSSSSAIRAVSWLYAKTSQDLLVLQHTVLGDLGRKHFTESFFQVC